MAAGCQEAREGVGEAMGDDWIKRTVDEKRAGEERGQRLQEQRRGEERVYDSKVDGLWQELLTELQRVAEQYNKQVAKKEEGVHASIDPGSRAFKAEKYDYPAGSLTCSFDRAGRRMIVSYSLKPRDGVPLQTSTLFVGIAVVGDHVAWVDGPQETKEQVARRVFEPFLRAI
jgi:hypothetical protein